MFFNKKLFIILLGVIVIFLTAFFLSKYYCDNKRFNREAVLKIVQNEMEKRGYTSDENEKLIHACIIKKYKDIWLVDINTKSKISEVGILGGECQITIDRLTGEVLSFLAFP